MYQYLFGPVPSRRLGISLGIDLVPKKVCTLNCVYCEVGRTTDLTLERKEYVEIDAIKNELVHYFQHFPNPDYITLSGSGEPTLNNQIAELIQFIKLEKPEVPIAIITNGTLLFDKEVRKTLLEADLVLPSFDAATDPVFRKINRPIKFLNIDQYLEGLVKFRHEFSGKIWLEILILPGFNDSKEELEALRKAILKIKPDKVQLNTLDRPGAVKNLKGATYEELKKISDYFDLDQLEIIGAFHKDKKMENGNKDIESTILSTLSRRPCTANDLSNILELTLEEIESQLNCLITEQRIQSVILKRGKFYQIKEGKS